MDTLDLLATDASPVPPLAGPATLVEHLDHYVGMVGALLYNIDRLIPVESLALTIGLNLKETHRVIDELNRRAGQSASWCTGWGTRSRFGDPRTPSRTTSYVALGGPTWAAAASTSARPGSFTKRGR